MTASPVEAKKVYTPEDVWQLSQQGENYELINGELFPMAPAKLKHGHITNWIAVLVTNYCVAHKLGVVYAADTTFRLPSGDLLCPDVSFVSKARAIVYSDEPGYQEAVPDFVVEVFSDSNTKIEMQQKADLFFPAGTKLMWVVYPNSRSVYVYTAQNVTRIYRETEKLDGGEVLPGLSIPVKDIFSILDE